MIKGRKKRGGFVHSIFVQGVPEQRKNPIEPLPRYFLESGYEGGYEGGYEVILEHTSVNPLSQFVARREQKEAAEDAMQQKSEESRAIT